MEHWMGIYNLTNVLGLGLPNVQTIHFAMT